MSYITGRMGITNRLKDNFNSYDINTKYLYIDSGHKAITTFQI